MISAVHFYNQGIRQGILTQSWPDLEHLIKVHTADFVFLGSRPSNPSTGLERYLRLYGTNARGKMGSEVRVRHNSFVSPKRAFGSHFSTVTRIVTRRCWTADADCGWDLVQDLEYLLGELRRKGMMMQSEMGLVPKIVCQPETMSDVPQKYNACMKGLNTWLEKAEQEGRARMCQALDKK